ncbi:DUF6864 domain-containing function [Leptospira haakeii]|uniref:Uncharacterized protein n=1 Tax=Leptospira haakeii TaxID=2023198 RepID=A0ABX4PIX2_9LEPT|nr:hypothetical protein [Leptospira haakeii]PKA14338.1 hypothetical protein CH363_19260 [Leptospira haakeii]PKA18196.1 hypothetical protein CH377_19015 [Leptospira haakeii]
MKITFGEYELVHSGVLIEIKDNPIKIVLPDEIEGDYSFLINFESNSEIKEPKTNIKRIDRFTLKIDFINFTNFQGGGNTNLIELGTLKNRPLYFNYRIFDLPTAGKSILFNFYIREHENGEQ